MDIEVKFSAKKDISIPIDNVMLPGQLMIPSGATGLVIFSHGSGSSRLSPRNNMVAEVLRRQGMGTLLFDLLTASEDDDYDMRFNIPLLTKRLTAATGWVMGLPETEKLHVGYFGASTGAASALSAAAELRSTIKAVVSRGGRPDLAMNSLAKVKAPVLLIVGEYDEEVIALNQKAFTELHCEKELRIIPGATHLFEEPGKLQQVARFSSEWFTKYL